MSYQRTYEKELSRFKESIAQHTFERKQSDLAALIEQIIEELEDIIFDGTERPKWIRVIFNIGKVVARIVSLIVAYRAEKKVRALIALENEKRGPKTKDGYLE